MIKKSMFERVLYTIQTACQKLNKGGGQRKKFLLKIKFNLDLVEIYEKTVVLVFKRLFFSGKFFLKNLCFYRKKSNCLACNFFRLKHISLFLMT